MTDYCRFFTSPTFGSERNVDQLYLGMTAAEVAGEDTIAGTSIGEVLGYAPPDDGALSLTQKWQTRYNVSTKAVTYTAVARRSAVTAALLAIRKAVLKRNALEAYRLDRDIDDATLSAIAAYVASVDGLSSLTAAEPTFPTETADPDGFRLFDRIFRRGNAVGTVSRTILGRPTGAILEEGSNANGDYVRVIGGALGGFQACWATLTLSAAVYTWTMPAAFLGTAYTPGGFVRNSAGNAYTVKTRDRLSTSCGFHLRNTSGTLVADTVDAFAIGRWA